MLSIKNYEESIKILKEPVRATVYPQTNILDADALNKTFASFEASLNSLYEKTRVAVELKNHMETFIDERITYAKNRVNASQARIEASMLARTYKNEYRYYGDTFLQDDPLSTYYDRDGRAFAGCEINKGSIVPSTSHTSGGQYGAVYGRDGEVVIAKEDYKKDRGIQILIEDEERLGGAVKSVFRFVPETPIMCNRISFDIMNGDVVSVSVFNEYNVETVIEDLDTCKFLDQTVTSIQFTIITTQEVL